MSQIIPSNQKIYDNAHIATNSGQEIPWTLNAADNSISVGLEDIKRAMSLSETSPFENEFLPLLDKPEQNKFFEYISKLFQGEEPAQLRFV